MVVTGAEVTAAEAMGVGSVEATVTAGEVALGDGHEGEEEDGFIEVLAGKDGSPSFEVETPLLVPPI